MSYNNNNNNNNNNNIITIIIIIIIIIRRSSFPAEFNLNQDLDISVYTNYTVSSKSKPCIFLTPVMLYCHNLFTFLAVYIHSLHVTAQNTSSTSLAVSWNYPEQLIHGIFCAVDISYRVINSVERQIVGVTSGSTEFEVKNLKPYTLYAITVTPFTHEGKGKESDEAIARTSEGGKL